MRQLVPNYNEQKNNKQLKKIWLYLKIWCKPRLAQCVVINAIMTYVRSSTTSLTSPFGRDKLVACAIYRPFYTPYMHVVGITL